jgi:hypothetical protein
LRYLDEKGRKAVERIEALKHTPELADRHGMKVVSVYTKRGECWFRVGDKNINDAAVRAANMLASRLGRAAT